jgi:hypothetical protein
LNTSTNQEQFKRKSGNLALMSGQDLLVLPVVIDDKEFFELLFCMFKSF